jgi:hypothetical protein
VEYEATVDTVWCAGQGFSNRRPNTHVGDEQTQLLVAQKTTLFTKMGDHNLRCHWRPTKKPDVTLVRVFVREASTLLRRNRRR